MSATPQQRALQARLAAHSKWAQTDPVEGTAKARKVQRRRSLYAWPQSYRGSDIGT